MIGCNLKFLILTRFCCTCLIQVRKVCQSLAFLSPALCMAIACLTPKLNPWVDVAILTTGLGLSSFSLAGMGSMSHLLFQGICSWSKKHLMSGSVGIMFWSCIIYWYVERMHYCHNGNLISRHFCVLQYEDLRVILMNWVWMQHSGLYCTHQDISPKYASILLVSFSPIHSNLHMLTV